MKKIAILLFPAALLFFGCDHPESKATIDSLYEYPYDGCMYLGVTDGGLVHSETCKNPKHTCCGYKYCNDTLK